MHLLLLFALWLPSTARDTCRIAFSDSHVHLNDPDNWIGLMDEYGVDRAVVLAGRGADNAALAEAAHRWPGRFLPFLSLSPEHRAFRPAWDADDGRLEPLLDSLLQTGNYFGIGEISVVHFPGAGFPEADYSPMGRTMQGILRAARRYGVPVLVHSEVTRLREFESMLSAYPEVTVIWAHGGYTPLFLARRLLEKHPNLVYELSARTWVHHPRSPDYTFLRDGARVWEEWLALIEAMPHRFLVGTDAAGRSGIGDAEHIRSVQNILCQLSPPARARVARDNFTALLYRSGG
ncbi:MAG: amidohydrolase family protein [Gemmatimonadales bacterium]